MITGYMIFNPVKAILSVNSVFAKFKDDNINLVLQKALYCAFQLIILAIGLYKCNSMGLLPNTER